MGNACGIESDPEKQRSKEVDKFLSKENKKKRSEVKILLLGAGESGKSTIFKQMRILHSKGYSKEDRKRFTPVVFGNTLSAIRVLISAVAQLNLPFASRENQDIAERIAGIPEQSIILSADQVFTKEVADDIKLLWQDPAIQKAFQRGHEFQLSDNAAYFLSSLDKISDPGYLPSVDDVLRCRVKTVGIVEAEFAYKGYKFKMIDVGGQKSERRKWIHVFDDVTAIIFVTSLSEYNQTLLEDDKKNRIHESIELFEEICNCRYFPNTPIIIFFNKVDIFEEKIKTVDLKCAFPEYTGGCNSKNAYEFIKKKFEEQDKSKDRHLIPERTTATDTANIDKVFNSVKHIFLMNAFDEIF